MSKKQPRVPGTREHTLNREQRRHPEKLEPQDAPHAQVVPLERAGEALRQRRHPERVTAVARVERLVEREQHARRRFRSEPPLPPSIG